jgi:hypothetical protein
MMLAWAGGGREHGELAALHADLHALCAGVKTIIAL